MLAHVDQESVIPVVDMSIVSPVIGDGASTLLYSRVDALFENFITVPPIAVTLSNKTSTTRLILLFLLVVGVLFGVNKIANTIRAILLSQPKPTHHNDDKKWLLRAYIIGTIPNIYKSATNCFFSIIMSIN